MNDCVYVGTGKQPEWSVSYFAG